MIVDLRSDSLTQPCPGMRAAMAAAEVGDDVYGEDPAVNRLQDEFASLVGHEAGLFLPTGTQANLIATMVHARPGDSVILSESGHSVLYEGGGISRIAGVLARPVPSACCKIEPAEVASRIVQIDDPHFSRTRLVIIENTTNRGGGTVYSLEEVVALGGLCREHGLAFHCDGARFFNATVALGIQPSDMGQHFDSLAIGLAKGLGCPAGAVLTGSRDFIREARRYRKMLGGGMRQSGVLAAAALYALDNGHMEDLAEDHRRTAAFRSALEGAGFNFPQPSPTNIAYLQVEHALMTIGGLVQRGVRALPHDPHHVRVMFHRDIDDAGLAHAIDVFREVVEPAG